MRALDALNQSACRLALMLDVLVHNGNSGLFAWADTSLTVMPTATFPDMIRSVEQKRHYDVIAVALALIRAFPVS